MLGITMTTFGIPSKVFGLELETQFSHYGKYCSKRFLLKRTFVPADETKPYETVD